MDMIERLRAAEATIADQKRQIDELKEELRLRDVDELTGMHNLRWLREWWAGLRQPSATVGAVVFVDVDMLKRVNDTYGHKIGDRVITHVAAVLISSGCYGVRYGGDEFLVFVPTGWDVEETLSRITAGISACPIPTRDESITVSASLGARVVADGMDLWRMIHDADAAMYEAKRERSDGSRFRVTR